MSDLYSKTIGDKRVFVSLEPAEDLFFIQRLDTPEDEPQQVMAHLEGEYYQDEIYWREGFSIRHVDTGVVIQKGDSRVHLSHHEFDQLERFFMQFRTGILVPNA